MTIFAWFLLNKNKLMVVWSLVLGYGKEVRRFKQEMEEFE